MHAVLTELDRGGLVLQPYSLLAKVRGFILRFRDMRETC